MCSLFLCIESHKNNIAQQQDRSGSKCEILLIHLVKLQETVCQSLLGFHNQLELLQIEMRPERPKTSEALLVVIW